MPHRVRIADVAKQAGLSASTVSYVLNEREGVAISAETRAKVLAAAETLGYVANPIARALRTGRTNTVGLAVADLSQPFSALLLRHLVARAEESGAAVMVMQGGVEPVRAESLREMLQQWPVDGIIAEATPAWIQALRAAQQGRRLPYVRLDSLKPADASDYVEYTLRPGAEQAMAHLLAGGRRRIAFLAPEYGIGTEDDRYRAYADALAAAGLPEHRIPTDSTLRGDAHAALLADMEIHGPPDGVFCYNDEFAFGCLRAAADAGLRVPADLAVVGCDSLAEGLTCCPRLTSIAIPVAAICATAWEFLQNRLRAADTPRQSALFSTGLVVRESSQPGSL